ncbi:hypothetical protein M405DRAFT_811553 [Rhizopogon salebrosus TDB-379]|nr:hypothetical protein M405DRAFT_811553 [Rhizopogon salebrosus TDB-379]
MTGSAVWRKDDEGMAVCIMCVSFHKRCQHSKYALCLHQHLEPRLLLVRL